MSEEMKKEIAEQLARNKHLLEAAELERARRLADARRARASLQEAQRLVRKARSSAA